MEWQAFPPSIIMVIHKEKNTIDTYMGAQMLVVGSKHLKILSMIAGTIVAQFRYTLV